MTDEEAARAVPVERGVGWAQLDGRARWEELILPVISRDLLRSIAGDLRFRRSAEGRIESGPAGLRRTGLKLMFAGEPGTGKRLAARMLATDLGLPILSVDLAGVISRKRSESEERLDNLFATAERLQAILYFADAGTWFAERASPASGPAGKNDPDLVSLLARIDGYRGVVIFAATLGIAYAPVADRLDHVVEFPFPDEVGRGRIWPLLLPRSAHLGERELEFLATSFPLTGGAIKRCVAGAVSAATAEGTPAELRHFVAAVEFEYGDRLNSARARQALARFHDRTWDTMPLLAGSAQPNAPRGPAVATWPVAPPVAAPPGRLRVLRALVFAAIVAAALIGFLIAHSPRASIARTPSLTTHLAAGPLRISVPALWRRSAAPGGPQLGLTDELAAGPPAADGGTLVIGLDATAGTTLPAALRAALPSAPSAEVVTLDGTRFYRYLDLAPHGAGGTESVYIVPTTAGTVVAQCIARGAATSFPTTCERVVASLRLASGHVLPIGPSAAYASSLDAAIGTLDTAVTAATRSLESATTAPEQAAAAARIAAAYRAAAASVGALHAGAAQAANQAVGAALGATGDAYAGLAHAAAVRSTRSYDIARTSVAHADSVLRAAIARLATFGYSVR